MLSSSSSASPSITSSTQTQSTRKWPWYVTTALSLGGIGFGVASGLGKVTFDIAEVTIGGPIGWGILTGGVILLAVSGRQLVKAYQKDEATAVAIKIKEQDGHDIENPPLTTKKSKASFDQRNITRKKRDDRDKKKLLPSKEETSGLLRSDDAEKDEQSALPTEPHRVNVNFSVGKNPFKRSPQQKEVRFARTESEEDKQQLEASKLLSDRAVSQLLNDKLDTGFKDNAKSTTSSAAPLAPPITSSSAPLAPPPPSSSSTPSFSATKKPASGFGKDLLSQIHKGAKLKKTVIVPKKPVIDETVEDTHTEAKQSTAATTGSSVAPPKNSNMMAELIAKQAAKKAEQVNNNSLGTAGASSSSSATTTTVVPQIPRLKPTSQRAESHSNTSTAPQQGSMFKGILKPRSGSTSTTNNVDTTNNHSASNTTAPK